MENTFFSFVMSVFWSSFYVFLVNYFRKRDDFIINFQVFPFIFLLFLSIARLCLPFEPRHSYVIFSGKIYPFIYDLFRKDISISSLTFKPIDALSLLWFWVALFLLVYHFLVYRTVKIKLTSLEDTSSQDNKILYANLLKTSGVKEQVQVLQNDSIQSPFIFGLRRATIFIPHYPFSQEELVHIISHEINHFKRRDSWKKLALIFSKIIFWWNPLLLLFSHNFNQFLEIQCDQTTVKDYSRSEIEDYIKTMLLLIKNRLSKDKKLLTSESMSAFVSMSPCKDLGQRFRILRSPRKDRNRKGAYLSCVLGLVLFISSYFFTFHPMYWPKGMDNYYLAEELEIDEDKSFILRTEDGKYKLYENGSFASYIEDVSQEKYQRFKIYKEFEEEE